MIAQILVGLIAILIFVMFLVFIYLLPTIIAKSRKHPDQYNLSLVNLFLGWTVYGWFACLVWAFWRYNKKK